MPTQINSILTVLDNKGNYLFTIKFEELSGCIAIFEEKGDLDDTTGFYLEIFKDDWNGIKQFIDNSIFIQFIKNKRK